MNFRFTALISILLVLCLFQVQAQPNWHSFSGLEDLVNRVWERVDSAIGNLDQRLDSLFESSGLSNFTKSLEEVADCYEAELKGQQLDIFNGSVDFKSIISQYYQAFPDKTISRSGIENLLNSTLEIVTRCLDPQQSDTARYGFTELSDKSLEEVQALLGVQIPTEPVGNSTRRKRLSGSDAACQLSSASIPASFDWRNKNAVTAVKNQAQCGSCWIFGIVGSIESALVRSKKASQSVDLSEQQLVDCAKNNTCQGGNSRTAFSFIKSNGIASETSDSYVARQQTCKSYPAAYRIKDFCIRSKFRYTSNSLVENLSDDTIARALFQNGPLYILLNASPLHTRNYRGGLIDTSPCSTTINHAVLLIGYDSKDNSWILKNSWGASWGAKGFFRVVRGKNMCGINTEIAWPIL